MEQALVHLEAESKRVLSLERRAWEEKWTDLLSKVEKLRREVKQKDSVCFADFQQLKDEHESKILGLCASYQKMSEKNKTELYNFGYLLGYARLNHLRGWDVYKILKEIQEANFLVR